MSKKILAILLALSFVFAFAACTAKEEPETTAPVETTEDIFAQGETEAPVVDVTEAPVEGTEAPVEGETAVSEEATTEAANAMPQGTEAIVAYFNTAINNAKSNSKSIKSNYMIHSVYTDKISGLPGALESVGKSLIEDNMGEDDTKKNVTWSSAADKNAFFPVEGETYASKLTAADVKDAKITEKDGKWIIRITTKDDLRSEGYAHGKGHAPKAFNAVLPGLIDGYIPGIAKSLFSVGTVATAYPSSTVQVEIDPATGNVTHANYKLNWTLYIPLNGKDVVLPFATENDYNINW
ncbi:MAG: hypothetical protein U0L11_03225 [Acutalibacteraceae bacterium]|nr:hypothetical protein [Acutalibacteraceae bacterium]